MLKSREENRRSKTILLALVILVFLILIGTAHSQGEIRGFHNEHHHGRLHHWYQKLMRPNDPYLSCCSSNDCTPTQAKMVDGKWTALKAGRWITIPNENINSEESTDGHAHICWYPSTADTDEVLCFVKPGSGI